MSYKIDIDPQVHDQLRAMPVRMLQPFAEAIALLELAPWGGAPYTATNPEGSMRRLTFGPQASAFVVYMILEDQQRVDILKVMWVD